MMNLLIEVPCRVRSIGQLSKGHKNCIFRDREAMTA